MLTDEIVKLVHKSIVAAQKRKELPKFKIPQIIIETPNKEIFGDKSTNVSLILSKASKKTPDKIAEIIIKNLPKNKLIKEAKFVSGFINFFISEEWLQKQIPEILKQKNKYGSQKLDKKLKIQVEFGGVNPTGEMHLGHGRNLFIGDTLANCLKFLGHKVQREHYVNDYGNQIAIFGRSVELRYLELLGNQIEFPKEGYQGDYPIFLAEQIITKHGNKFLKQKPIERLEKITNLAVKLSIDHLKRASKMLQINFDNWFLESNLHKSGYFNKTIDLLEKKKLIYCEDGAIWFRTTKFGSNKDDVAIRSDETPTYFGSDIAYHRDKFEKRKFNKVIDVWGANNSGQVKRVEAACEALGYKDKLDIIIYQYVSLLKKGKKIGMSKRAGTYLTLEQLVDEVGLDVARYFFLTKSADTHLDFDLDLARLETEKNPVFYIQYAYARISSILRKTKIKNTNGLELELLNHPAEIKLIKLLIQFPEVLSEISKKYEVHKLNYYAYSLATAFHSFYKNCRVITDDQKLTKVRLNLIEAAKIVLENNLNILKISLPKKM